MAHQMPCRSCWHRAVMMSFVVREMLSAMSKLAVSSMASRKYGFISSRKLVAQRRGFKAYTVRIERHDWFKVGQSLLSRNYWTGTCTVDPGYRWKPCHLSCAWVAMTA